MFIPIIVVIVFSFNKPEGSFNYTWTAFSLDAWAHPCAIEGMCASVLLSLKIAVLSTHRRHDHRNDRPPSGWSGTTSGARAWPTS